MRSVVFVNRYFHPDHSATSQIASALASRRIDGEHDVVGDRAAQSLDAENEWSMLVDAIDVLPDAERHTLMLFVWEDLSYDDIARHFAIKSGTVGATLHQAIEKLRQVQIAGRLARGAMR